MKQLELSVAADADVVDILAYGTASFGEEASDSYYLDYAMSSISCASDRWRVSAMKTANWGCADGCIASTGFSIGWLRKRS